MTSTDDIIGTRNPTTPAPIKRSTEANYERARSSDGLKLTAGYRRIRVDLSTWRSLITGKVALKINNSIAKRCTAALVATALGSGLFTSPAQAVSGDVESAVVALVLNSADPAATYQGLSLDDRTEFDYWMLPVEEIDSTSIEPADQAARNASANGEEPAAVLAAAALTGCWYGKNTKGNKAAGGNTLYTYYVTLKWCTRNNKVTSAGLHEADGETKTPGWRYDGVKAKGSALIDNKGRAYAKHRFILGIGGFDIQSPEHCVRAWGYHNSSQAAFDRGCGTV